MLVCGWSAVDASLGKTKGKKEGRIAAIGVLKALVHPIHKPIRALCMEVLRPIARVTRRPSPRFQVLQPLTVFRRRRLQSTWKAEGLWCSRS